VRSRARIDRLMSLLREVWDQSPDLRLGQIVENARALQQGSHANTFYVEDDHIEIGLLLLLREVRRK
jgi:uncharacterized protein YihD (DUF1040 family)